MTVDRNVLEEIFRANETDANFDKWIKIEEKWSNYGWNNENLNIIHKDTTTILLHYKDIYEGNRPSPLHLKSTLEDIMNTLHHLAIKQRIAEEQNRATLDDWWDAYDIYYLIRDTFNYLKERAGETI